EVVPALGEHDVDAAAGDEQRHQHGGLLAPAAHLHPRRLLGLEQDVGELLAQCVYVSSMRSSKATSPSSVRWTGHLAAITCSRSTCSSLRCSGMRITSSKRVGQPRSAGE